MSQELLHWRRTMTSTYSFVCMSDLCVSVSLSVCPSLSNSVLAVCLCLCGCPGPPSPIVTIKFCPTGCLAQGICWPTYQLTCSSVSSTSCPCCLVQLFSGNTSACRSVNICIYFTSLAELGDYDPHVHVGNYASEFRFIPNQVSIDLKSNLHSNLLCQTHNPFIPAGCGG